MEIIEHNEQFTVVVDTIKSFEFYQTQLPFELINKALILFKSKQRVNEWLQTHYLLYKLTHTFQTYSFNEWKKPYCSITGQKISIAHSDTYSSIILAAKGMVGIDIEEKQRDFKKASVKYLHSDESKWVVTNEDLLKVWCLKESAYKLINNASYDFKNDYNCLIYQDRAEVFIYKPITKSVKMFFADNEKYFLTWCFEKE